MLIFKNMEHLHRYGFQETGCVNQRNKLPIYCKRLKVSGMCDDTIITAYVNPSGQDNPYALEIVLSIDTSKYSGIVEDDIPMDVIMDMLANGDIEWRKDK